MKLVQTIRSLFLYVVMFAVLVADEHRARRQRHGPVSVERVRPRMMTVVAILAGLVPTIGGKGTGSEIMQRIAVPMIGGIVSSTLLTLIVIPAVYCLVKGWQLPTELQSNRCLEEEACALEAAQ